MATKATYRSVTSWPHGDASRRDRERHYVYVSRQPTEKDLDRIIALGLARQAARRARRVARGAVVERIMGDALTAAHAYQRSNVVVPADFRGTITITITVN